MERVDQLERPPEDQPGAEKPHELLPRLVTAAQGATGPSRTEVAGLINDALVAMRAPGDEAQEAQVLVAQLDAGLLAKLTDAKGRNCRKEAIDTLLALGYPYALRVSPEELSFVRGWRPREDANVGEWVKSARLRRRVAAGLVVAGQAIALLVALFAHLDWVSTLVVIVAALASSVAAVMFVRSKPAPDTLAQPVTMLVLAGILQFVGAMSGVPGAAVGTALNALATFLVLEFGSR